LADVRDVSEMRLSAKRIWTHPIHSTPSTFFCRFFFFSGFVVHIFVSFDMNIMASLFEDGEDCAICLKAMEIPVVLPCSHKYCLQCLEHWRPKHDIYSQRKCPQCRQTIPPTREMIADIDSIRSSLKSIQDQLVSSIPLEIPTRPCFEKILQLPVDQQQPAIRWALERRAARHILRIEAFEKQYDSYKDVLDDSLSYEVLPFELVVAVFHNDIPTILNWLGPPPVSYKRLHAKCLSFSDDTLLHMAAHSHNITVLELLLHYGAKVDTPNIHQFTPLFHAVTEQDTHDTAGKILLEWGAKKELPQFWNASSNYLATLADEHGKIDLAHLLQTPFGGRRCELVGLEKDTDLNGKTGIVGKYDSDKDQYQCVLEETNEQVEARSINLERCDRRPSNSEYKVRFHTPKTKTPILFWRKMQL
jgi:hypothetical protein